MSSTCTLLIELWKFLAYMVHLYLNSAYYASRYVLHFKWECMDLCQKRHDGWETNLKYDNQQSRVTRKSYKFGWCWISHMLNISWPNGPMVWPLMNIFMCGVDVWHEETICLLCGQLCRPFVQLQTSYGCSYEIRWICFL